MTPLTDSYTMKVCFLELTRRKDKTGPTIDYGNARAALEAVFEPGLSDWMAIFDEPLSDILYDYGAYGADVALECHPTHTIFRWKDGTMNRLSVARGDAIFSPEAYRALFGTETELEPTIVAWEKRLEEERRAEERQSAERAKELTELKAAAALIEDKYPNAARKLLGKPPSDNSDLPF